MPLAALELARISIANSRQCNCRPLLPELDAAITTMATAIADHSAVT
jgi:hypothetical protein